VAVAGCDTAARVAWRVLSAATLHNIYYMNLKSGVRWERRNAPYWVQT